MQQGAQAGSRPPSRSSRRWQHDGGPFRVEEGRWKLEGGTCVRTCVTPLSAMPSSSRRYLPSCRPRRSSPPLLMASTCSEADEERRNRA